LCFLSSRYGRFMLSASWDRTVRMRDMKTGKELRAFTGHTEKVPNVAITTDATRAISASEDGTVRLWDVDTGKELYRCKGHEGKAVGVAITSNGRYALPGGQDGTVRLGRL